VSCLLTVTLHIVDVRLTIDMSNKYYLLTYLLLLRAMGQQETLGDGTKVARDQLLGTAERKYYSDMCDQLFRKYTDIKSRTAEDGGKKSHVWRCFQPTNETAALCKLCRREVRRGPRGSTTNLAAHLQRHHGKEFTDMVEKDAIKQVPAVAHGNTIYPCPSPPHVGAPAPRALPSRHNVAVVSHVQYVLTVTAALPYMHNAFNVIL